MKQEYKAGWKEAISQLDDYYSPQVESLQDQTLISSVRTRTTNLTTVVSGESSKTR